MTEAPLLNNDAARSATGEILDQASTQALETRRTELETARVANEAKTTPTTDQSQSDTSKTPKSDDVSLETEDGKTLLTKKDGVEEPKTDVKAPDAYAAFTAPEGFTLDPKAIEAATPIFKELGLTQEQAQRLVSLNAAQQIEAAKAPQATYEATRRDWQAKVHADTEMAAYSRDGKTGLDAVKIDLGRAIAVMGPELGKEFKAAMDLTGAGDNPAFVKGFWKLAQQVVEGKSVSGKGPSPLGQVDPTKPAKTVGAHAMYPNLAN